MEPRVLRSVVLIASPRISTPLHRMGYGARTRREENGSVPFGSAPVARVSGGMRLIGCGERHPNDGSLSRRWIVRWKTRARRGRRIRWLPFGEQSPANRAHSIKLAKRSHDRDSRLKMGLLLQARHFLFGKGGLQQSGKGRWFFLHARYLRARNKSGQSVLVLKCGQQMVEAEKQNRGAMRAMGVTANAECRRHNLFSFSRRKHRMRHPRENHA